MIQWLESLRKKNKKKERERAKERETDTLGELHMKSEAEIREGCLPAKKCQGHQQPPEGGREAWNSYFRAPRRKQPYWFSEFGLPASRSVRE